MAFKSLRIEETAGVNRRVHVDTRIDCDPAVTLATTTGRAHENTRMSRRNTTRYGGGGRLRGDTRSVINASQSEGVTRVRRGLRFRKGSSQQQQPSSEGEILM